MRKILKWKFSVSKGVQKMFHSEKSLHTASRNPHFSFQLFGHIKWSRFGSNGIGRIFQKISFGDDVEWDHKIVEDGIGLNRLEQFSTNGKKLTNSTNGWVKFGIFCLKPRLEFPVNSFARFGSTCFISTDNFLASSNATNCLVEEFGGYDFYGLLV